MKILCAGFIYDDKEVNALIQASKDFWLVGGRRVSQFEKDLAKYLGRKYCVLCNSGSSANLLAVSSLTSKLLGNERFKKGQEVITTASSFPTTVNPIIQNGLIPVFIDVGIDDYNIDVNKIADAVTNKTVGIMIAHTLGNPAKLKELMELVNFYDLWYIEDNCDSLGSKYQGKFTGTFGQVSTLSFYPAHHITIGEGGAVLTDNEKIYKAVLSFRDWGRDCWCLPGHDNTCGHRFSQSHGKLPPFYDHKYTYSHLGYNLKSNDLQASIGIEQLKKLDGFIWKRRFNYQYLYNNLVKRKDFRLLKPQKNSQPSWFGFPILAKNRTYWIDRLEGKGIATRMLFGGNLTKQPAYQGVKYRVSGELKNTDRLMNELFWIGVYPGIGKEQLDYMLEAFK